MENQDLNLKRNEYLPDLKPKKEYLIPFKMYFSKNVFRKLYVLKRILGKPITKLVVYLIEEAYNQLTEEEQNAKRSG